ncbi:protein TolR [Photobacterium angustum]|uniref:Tol-Pal system protein TolR n=1 Tax=Photobacterium angustum TaxID=661 RepID=A0A855SKQ6_PHOAN|nr:protein TolR [Photobacterium angustum]KJF82720.1 biopolymer transporter TolR [Photobacterium damselae subsp. damselae]KJG40476.1 biopolymer transporter TolR [Photobacterium angustum]KJG42068.1 biopolymer transporter TolR [Photobacterium angustum]KJG46858.1 biopolymer transporter TolR [Photobacterium angustum]KJG50814.1 biopolymer transporter TolR [Photobacterium angustum]
MAYQPKKRKMTAEINVVPYIDVMLVLLIIFMVTAPFVSQGVDVDLPQTTTAETVAEMNKDSDIPPIIVEVDKDGYLGVSIDNADMQRGLSLQEVLARVKAQMAAEPKSLVMVGGDGRTPYAHIIETLDALNQAGVGSVGLMTEPLEQ